MHSWKEKTMYVGYIHRLRNIYNRLEHVLIVVWKFIWG